MNYYLYNGVKLPDINTVWTDKEKYPYAVIYTKPNEYSLRLTQYPIQCQIKNVSSITLYDRYGAMACSYKLNVESGMWELSWSGVTEGESGFFFSYNGTDGIRPDVIWANHDVYHYGSEDVYLFASDSANVLNPTAILMGFLTGMEIKRSGEPKTPVAYLTFASAEPFTIGVKNETKNWDGTLYYSADTETWNEWDGMTAIESAKHDGENKIYMRGSGNSVITGYNANATWVLTGTDIRCNGNIENLLDYDTVAHSGHPAMADRCYCAMFSGCTSLTQAPELPATTLTEWCYGAMFDGCTSLTQAPVLPATTLAGYCYKSMFSGCTSLTQAPVLPATTLAEYCYGTMFYRCKSLTQAPELPATTLAEGCYRAIFESCTSLTQAPVLPATTLAGYCYYYMFLNCPNLIQVPALPATTLARACYAYMFDGCDNIKLSKTQTEEYPTEYRIPTIGTGDDADSSCYRMFFRTGGTFRDTVEINTTYYLHKDNVIACCDSVANL